MANSVDPDQTAPIGAVCSGSMLFVFILNSSVMLSNYLQQTTSADDISDAFFFGALRVNSCENLLEKAQGATASSHIPPPLLQDPWSCLQLLCAECHTLCQ